MSSPHPKQKYSVPAKAMAMFLHVSGVNRNRALALFTLITISRDFRIPAERVQYTHCSRPFTLYAKGLGTRLPSTGGDDVCPYCRLSPCIITRPPNWLRGSSQASLGNQAKRFCLYKKFWTLLGQLGLWNDPHYLAL